MSTISADTRNREILPRLQEAQRKYGSVTEEAMIEIADAVGVSRSVVYGVATFYHFLSVEPLGKNVIRICKSLPCNLKGAQMIIESIGKELGIAPGETTKDGTFSFTLTNCIGACDKAPAMLVNDEVHGDLTPEKIKQILKSYGQK